jgi:hypothetical protein
MGGKLGFKRLLGAAPAGGRPVVKAERASAALATATARLFSQGSQVLGVLKPLSPKRFATLDQKLEGFEALARPLLARLRPSAAGGPAVHGEAGAPEALAAALEPLDERSLPAWLAPTRR